MVKDCYDMLSKSGELHDRECCDTAQNESTFCCNVHLLTDP